MTKTKSMQQPAKKEQSQASRPKSGQTMEKILWEQSQRNVLRPAKQNVCRDAKPISSMFTR